MRENGDGSSDAKLRRTKMIQIQKLISETAAQSKKKTKREKIEKKPFMTKKANTYPQNCKTKRIWAIMPLPRDALLYGKYYPVDNRKSFCYKHFLVQQVATQFWKKGIHTSTHMHTPSTHPITTQRCDSINCHCAFGP